MGVAVGGAGFVAFGAGFELAKAGMVVGPKAVVNARSRAIVRRGISDIDALDIFSMSNIILLRPGEQSSSCRGRKVSRELWLNRDENECSGRMFQRGYVRIKNK